MNSKELQDVYAPQQLGDSHTLSFPGDEGLAPVYFDVPTAATDNTMTHDTFTD